MKKTRTTITKKRKKQLTKRKHYKKYLMILVTLGVLVFLFYRGDILLNSVSFSPLNKIKQAQADGIELRNYACDSLEDDSK